MFHSSFKILFFACAFLAVPSVAAAQDLPDFGGDSGGDVFGFLSSGAGEGNSVSGGQGQSGERFDFEKSDEELAEDARRKAFQVALEAMLPLRPDEIRTLIEKIDRTNEAASFPVYPPPRPEVAVETLSSDPGAEPVMIRLAEGYVTTFNVVDSTGAPWPIEDITWAGDFDIKHDGQAEAGYYVRITANSPRAYGNMSLKLVGMQTPIILTMESGRDVVHYRFDAIIPELGPMAKAPLMQRSGISVAAGDRNISSILEGVIPPNASRLNVSGLDGRSSAYSLNGMTYLRTPHTLLSPSWSGSATSVDGMNVYVMRSAPVLLLSDSGRMVRARLSTREGVFDE